MLKLRWQQDTSPIWDDETLTRIESILNKKYRAFLRDEGFEVEGGKTDEVVQIRMTLARGDGTVIYPVEAILPRDSQEEAEAEELALLLVDYLDVYWNEYLSEGRETFLPLDWSRHECEGVEFFLRGFVRNLSAEAMAEELFRTHGTGGHLIEGISSET
jgi:hypothetical protein